MNSEIGKRIKDRRNELGISAVDIAAKTGLSKATIHRYESGEINKIKLPVIVAIAEMLDVNPSWIVGKSKQKEVLKCDNNIKISLDKIMIQLKKGGAVYNNNLVSGTDMKILYSFLESYCEYLDGKYK